MNLLIVILLIIVVIFGVSSGMQSYATAQQAQATIEVAQVAQVNAWGNLVTILTIALVLVVFVALAAALLWFMWKRSTLNMQRATRITRSPAVVGDQPKPQLSTSELIQLLTLDILQSMRSGSPPALLNANTDKSVSREDNEEPLNWLRLR